ncbi:MAG: hypothetical protein KDA24_00325 [Deltaproteobacteria bacterium]|nr:hypothetical protein [Deltaproteobacteria bacterium]
MSLPDDATLVALCERMGSGDSDAAAEMWDAVSPWVYAALLRLLRDPEAAELLSRRTLVEMWRAAPLYDQHVGRPLLWALSMARSLGVEWLEERRRAHASGPATTPPSLAERAEAREASGHISAALDASGHRDHLEAAWFSHPIDESGAAVPNPATLDEPLRAFARALAEG